MRRVLLAVFGSFALVSLVLAADSEKKMKPAAGSDEEAITKLEEEWTAALLKADVAAIERITSPEWMLTTAEGKLLNREQANADLKSGALKFESMTLNELTVKVHGTTAIAFGLDTDKATYKGKDISGQYRFTDVFMKRDGRWQCIVTHVTKVAAPMPASTQQ